MPASPFDDLQPPAGSPFAALSAPSPFDPEARASAREINSVTAGVTYDAITSNQSLPTRPLFDPSPLGTNKDLFSYIDEYTQGALKVNPAGLTPEQLEKARLAVRLSLKQNRPNAYSVYSQAPDATKQQLDALERTAAWLNAAPLTPAEHMRGAALAIQELQKSAAANLVDPDYVGTKPTSVPADQLLDWYARTQAHDIGLTDGYNAVSPEDRKIADAVGGFRTQHFIRDRSKFWGRRLRLGALTGRAAFDPNAPPIDFQHDDPSKPLPPGIRRGMGPAIVDDNGAVSYAPRVGKFNLENPDVEIADLASVSPLAAGLIQAGQNIGVTKAQELSAFNAAAGENLIGAAASAKLLDLAGGPDQPPTTSMFTDLHNMGMSILWRAGKAAAFDVAPTALSLITAGAFNDIMKAPRETVDAVSVLATGKSDSLRTLYQRFGHYYARNAALRGAAAGSTPDEDLIREAESFETDFPDLPETAKHSLRNDFFGTTRSINDSIRRMSEGKSVFGTAGRLLTEAYNLDDTSVRGLVGDTIGAMLDHPGDAAFALLGARGAMRRAGPHGTPRSPKSPLEAYHTPLDTLPLARRIDGIVTQIESLGDRAAIDQFNSRLTRALKTSLDPVTPEQVGQIQTALDRFTAETRKLDFSPLTPESKAAVRNLAEPLASINPIDAAFALTGKELLGGPSASIKRVDALTKWYDEQSKSLNALDMPRLPDRSPAHMVAVQAGLMKHAERLQDFALRQTRLTDITSHLTDRTRAELLELQASSDSALALKTISDSSFNDYIDAVTAKTLDLETNGGLRTLPNPRLKTANFRDLNNALLDGTYESLLPLLKRRTLTEGTTIQADLAALETGPYGAPLRRPNLRAEQTALLRSWATAKVREMLQPVTEPIPPSLKPNTDLAKSIASRVSEARAAGDSAALTKAELDWLNSSPVRPPVEIPSRSLVSDTYAKQVRDFSTRMADRQSFLKDLNGFKKHLSTLTPDNPALKLDAKLQRRIEDSLGLKPGEEPIFAPKYRSLAPDALEVPAVEAWRESVADLSRERQSLKAQLNHLASVEFAAIGSNPLVLLHEQEWIDRSSRGALEWDHYTAEVLTQRLGRAVTPAEQIAFYNALKTGKAVNAESLNLIQQHRFGLLRQCLDAGVISPDQFVDYTGRSYAHGIFDRQTQYELTSAFARRKTRSPAGYGPLRVDPGAFHHMIPDQGRAYVAYKDVAGVLHTKDGFPTPEAAESWISQNLPKGSEAEVAETWPLVEKKLSDLVTEPGASHLDLTRQLTLAAHNARISQFITTAAVKRGKDVHYVSRRLSDLEFATQKGQGRFVGDSRNVWVSADGAQTYHLVSNPRNRWLDGRYVEPAALRWLQETQSSFGFADALTQAAADEHPMASGWFNRQSRYFDAAKRVAKSVFPSGGNVFSFVKIAANYKTVVKNLMQNYLIDLTNTVPDWWHPTKFPHVLKFAWEGMRSRLSGRTLEDPTWQALAKADIVRFSNESGWHKSKSATHARNVEAELQKSWKSVEGLQARRLDFESELSRALESGDNALVTKIQTKLVDLDNQLQAANVSAARGFFRSSLRHATSLFGDFADAVVHGTGKMHENVWNFYNEVTHDRLVKYIAHRCLRELHHMDEQPALQRITDYTQQLHRVHPQVKKIGRAIGGAMYASFPFDQARKFGNLLKNEPDLAVGLMFKIAGWNALALSGSGNDMDEYLSWSALRSGVRRDGISDARTLLGGLLVPGPAGNLFSVSLGPGLWDFLTPQSAPSKALADIALGDNQNAGLDLAVRSGIGAASKYVGADIYVSLISGLVTRKDQRGDPLKNMADVMKWIGQSYLTPAGFPGSSEFTAVRRALGSEAIDLKTGRQEPFLNTLAHLTGVVRETADTPSRFRSAMIAQLRASGTAPQVQRMEAEDETLNALLARGAARSDGTIDPVLAKPIIEKYHADHPKGHLTPEGLKVLDDYSEDSIKDALDNAAWPSTLRTFRKLNVPTQLSTYSLWRSIDSAATTKDPAWTKRVRDILFDKLTARKLGSDTINESLTRIDEALKSERLDPAARQDLLLFQLLLNRMRLPK